MELYLPAVVGSPKKCTGRSPLNAIRSLNEELHGTARRSWRSASSVGDTRSFLGVLTWRCVATAGRTLL
jgi:hypothetical protein